MNRVPLNITAQTQLEKKKPKANSNLKKKSQLTIKIMSPFSWTAFVEKEMYILLSVLSRMVFSDL